MGDKSFYLILLLVEVLLLYRLVLCIVDDYTMTNSLNLSL